MKCFLKSKIHRATVTEANLNYIGSISIDSALMQKAGIEEFEKVLVCNINNGERIETYAVKAEADSGTICLNGAAARKFLAGDLVIILAFEYSDKPVKPKIVLVNEKNAFAEFL
ncbi:MAG: aspartate 1-decarboxylase [archaeon]